MEQGLCQHPVATVAQRAGAVTVALARLGGREKALEKIPPCLVEVRREGLALNVAIELLARGLSVA